MIAITAAVCLKIVVPPAEYRPVARMPRCNAIPGITVIVAFTGYDLAAVPLKKQPCVFINMKLRRVAFRITAIGFYETNDHFVATQPLNNLCSRTVNYISAAPTALKGDFPLAVLANAFAVVLGFSDRYIMLAGSTVCVFRRFSLGIIIEDIMRQGLSVHKAFDVPG